MKICEYTITGRISKPKINTHITGTLSGSMALDGSGRCVSVMFETSDRRMVSFTREERDIILAGFDRFDEKKGKI